MFDDYMVKPSPCRNVPQFSATTSTTSATTMLISLTVGKVDAGVAVLLTQDKRLIEFPSILLPPNISSGSIVDITVSRNFISEQKSQSAFLALQESIYTSFGESEPLPPILHCKNATQTSVVLEWDPIELATADCISLSLFRNGQKAGNIPRPTSMRTTKISGLAVDTEYTFHLVLRTSAGTFSSEKVVVKTHKMTDLSGITVTPGILPAQLRDSLTKAVERIGAKLADTVRIDTTHFVTTEGRGIAWEKAVEMNIPVVRPEWVEGCERGGRIVGVRQYYLDADPRQRQIAEHNVTSQPQQQPEQKAHESPLPSPGAEQQTNGSQAVPPTPPAKDVPGEKEEESSDDSEGEEDGDVEEEKTAVQEEQKVRIEDRELQKVAIHPTPAAEEKEKEKEKEGAEESGSGTITPGQSSFQDVAL
ncbi:Chitin biosynthesis protein CHS5 [Lachnellula arida]|uniref:Chitin biosynthesis protein CHS5 n=1 Tax=Lachnellula arida TaxID=1316785 RepID=A0A8T9AY84_9HELO|nr:Chitin biosynthesis protein CHS5 [Lachnellula arida]